MRRGTRRNSSCPFQQDRFLQDIAPRIAGGEEIEYEIAPWDQGKSGGSVDREGLQWVLANLDRFEEVWVYDHDRLIRHAVFGPWVMGEIRQRGIRLWGPWGEDAPTPMGRFMTDVRMRFGAFYREESSDRTKENLDHRLREGLWMNHAPAGYTFAFENGEGSRRLLVPDPQTAETVQQLFRMMADGVSQKRAAQELGLNTTTVLWWRHNPLYIGLVYKYRKNINALKDRSHFALWALAIDPGCDWLFPGRHEPLDRRGDLGQATGEPRHPLNTRSAAQRAPGPLRADQVRVRQEDDHPPDEREPLPGRPLPGLWVAALLPLRREHGPERDRAALLLHSV